MNEMTQAEYAKHRQVSRVAVTKWKQKGLLVLNESGKIVVNQTDERLNQVNSLEENPVNKLTVLVNRLTTGPGNQLTESTAICAGNEPDNQDENQSIDADDAIPDLPKEIEEALGGRLLSKHEAETLKENYLAKLRQLEYEKKAGRVVEVEPLKKVIFELWRRERDALLNLPSRIGAVIAAELEIDQNRLVILLERHINEFLNERADQPRIRLV
jgi:hypothetical protein